MGPTSPTTRPEKKGDKGYAGNRRPSWCDRIIVWRPPPKKAGGDVEKEGTDMETKYGPGVLYFSIDKGEFIVKSDHDMVVGYLPNAEGMKVLIVSWNMDNERTKGKNIVEAKDLIPFIQSNVNAKQAGLFDNIDLYFFSFQEVGTRQAAGNTGEKLIKTQKDREIRAAVGWHFLKEFKSIDERFDKKSEKGKLYDWKQVSMYGTDEQGTVGFIVYNSNLIKYDDKGVNAPVVNKEFGHGNTPGNKAFLLSGQFQKGESNFPLTFAAAHLPFKPGLPKVGCVPPKPYGTHTCGLEEREKAMKMISDAFEKRQKVKKGSLILAGDLNFRTVKNDYEQLLKYMTPKGWKEIKHKDQSNDPPFAYTCKRKKAKE